jgi:isopentenyl-diphosphate Delta-isomerase
VTATMPAAIVVVSIAEDGTRGEPVSLLLAHQPEGLLHLAVSVQLLDSKGLWLLQRRATSKQLFANRWANSCCTHPRPGESPEAAARRAVADELGLAVELRAAGEFTYRAIDAESGLVEYEQDHVFVGFADTSAVAPDGGHVADLAALGFEDALRITGSVAGAPWASEVLSRCSAVLESRFVTDRGDRSVQSQHGRQALPGSIARSAHGPNPPPPSLGRASDRRPKRGEDGGQENPSEDGGRRKAWSERRVRQRPAGGAGL